MMVCSRVRVYGIGSTSALYPRAEVGRGEVALEEDEQHHSRQGQDDGAGQRHPEGVVLGRRRVIDVVRQRDRERLHGPLLGDQERPQELVPRTDEGQQGVTGHVVAGCQGSWLVRRLSASNMVMPCLAAVAVSYTHLTLPTNREV